MSLEIVNARLLDDGHYRRCNQQNRGGSIDETTDYKQENRQYEHDHQGVAPAERY